MTDRFSEENYSKRMKAVVIVLLILTILYMITVMGLFMEPKNEPEGIFVRFILFFKQSMLL